MAAPRALARQATQARNTVNRTALGKAAALSLGPTNTETKMETTAATDRTEEHPTASAQEYDEICYCSRFGVSHRHKIKRPREASSLRGLKRKR